MKDKNRLKQKTISGMIWSFSGTIGQQFIQLLIQIVLARLLVPEDFGIIGMVLIFTNLSQTFIDSGFTKGLIREQDSTDEDYATVFFFNLSVALVLYIILFFSAGAISEFFRQPDIVVILRVIGIILIINAFGLIQRTILIKNVDFKTQTKINIISAVVSGVVAIIFAYVGFGVWALVIQKILMQFLQALLLSLTNRWMPPLVFSTRSFKRLFGFGWKLLVSSLIASLYKEVNQIIIGRIFSATDLGFYTNAKKIKNTAANSITQSVQKVSYPVLSEIQNDPKMLRNSYRKIIKTTVYVTFPFMLGIAVIAPAMVPALLGEKWIPSVPLLQILCLGGMLYPIHAINLNILQVKGRSDLFLKIEIIKKIIGLTLIAIAIYLKLGIPGILWAGVINSYLGIFINTYNSKELANYSTIEQLKDLRKITLITLLMAVGTYGIGEMATVHYFYVLGMQIMAGVSLYVGLSIVFNVEEFYTIRDIVTPVIKRMIHKK